MSQAEALLDDEPEPHVDLDEPASTLAVIMGAVGTSQVSIALDWARSLLDYLQTAPYHGQREDQSPLSSPCAVPDLA